MAEKFTEVDLGEGFDVDAYIASMSPEAKAALIGLVIAVENMDRFNQDDKLWGRGGLGFGRNVGPDPFLNEVFDLGRTLQQDMRRSTGADAQPAGV